MAVYYTDVKICNLALSKLGEAPITSLSDSTNKARTLNAMYGLKRDELLRMHPWGFAKKRQSLAKDLVKPLFEFSNQFLIPSDCLRILKIDAEDKYSREGDKVLSNASEVFLFYIFRNEDPNSWDSEFVSLFANYLAIDLVWNLKGTRTLRADLDREFQEKLALARHTSATESTGLDSLEYNGQGTLIAVRQGRPESY
jgi:hypothetical protein